MDKKIPPADNTGAKQADRTIKSIPDNWSDSKLISTDTRVVPCRVSRNANGKKDVQPWPDRNALPLSQVSTKSVLVPDTALPGVVLDADTPEHADTVRQLLQEHGAGYTEIATPSGGCHFWTTGKGPFRQKSVNGAAEKLDLRIPGAGTHKIFLPGSRFEDGSAGWFVTDQREGKDVGQDELDAILKAYRGTHKPQPVQVDLSPEAPQKTSVQASGGRWDPPAEGAGHQSIVSIAGQLRKAGVPEEVALKTVQTTVAEWQSPETDEEIRRQVRDVFQRYPSEAEPEFTLNIESAEAIRTADIPPRRWFAYGLLTVGFAVLAARKGIGKSMFAFQLAYAIASGAFFLGRQTSKAKVLYVVTELDRTAVHERLERFGRAPEDLYFQFGWRNGYQGIEDAERVIKENGIEVVIVDMFTGVLPHGTETNSYDTTPFYLAWRQMAHRTGAGVLAIWHSPKISKEDPVSNVLGSTGLAGQSDSVIVIDRARTRPETEMFVGGNHGKEEKQKLWFDFPYFTNAISTGPEDEDRPQPADEPVLTWLKKNGEASSPHVAANLNRKNDHVRQSLHRLLHKGLVEKLPGHIWKATFPPEQAEG